METRKIFKCLISSPGDCNTEREICQKVINKVNSGLAKHLGVNFETFMWEYNVLPDMGKNGQEIIDEDIEKSKYDIFIGIMKNRFGHPTKKAGSGTEHEFNEALSRKLKSDNNLPRIIFYFGKEKVDLNVKDIDEILEQHKQVKAFKKKIGEEGLYVDFDSKETFEKDIEEKLNLFIQKNTGIDQPEKKVEQIDFILKRLEIDFKEALKSFNEDAPVWIEPIISKKREVPKNPSLNKESNIDINFFIDTPNNAIIKAPTEFGLTSLAHYLKLEAWKNGKTFLYIDAKKTKKHKVVNDLKKALEEYFFKTEVKTIDYILLDSVCFEENGIMHIIKNICDTYPDTPLLIFNTTDNNFFLQSEEDIQVEIKKVFSIFYLLPLPQNEVRKIVTSYSLIKCLNEDEDALLNKVTKDLEILNLHRTPKNCISLLKASSKIGNDYGPINRTKLIEIILNTIFEDYEIPTYKDKKPDVKDCIFLLSYFCEILTLRNDFEFSQQFFKETLKDFSSVNHIEIDLVYLFNALIDNSIFAKKFGDNYFFKNSYWVFYFLANRMSLNKEFLQNVYENKRYIDYPEIIEFYSGIDRNKADALEVLIKDIAETIDVVKSKVNLPDTLNPFKAISWNPDPADLVTEEQKISKTVLSSGFPNEVKDKYNDKHYNQIRPYHQVISTVFREYSYLLLMRQIAACSRVLRNSDYVKAELKEKMLDYILKGWNELSKLLIILTPLLAEKGNVSFDGASFYLDEDDFNINDPIKKRFAVLTSVPTNVVKFFKDDIISNKIAPLLISQAEVVPNSLLKHEIMLLIASERPKNWRSVIDKYIVDLDKNSFFLFDILLTLSHILDYKSTDMDERRNIEHLMKKCRAKHLYKKDNPDIGLINKIKN